MWVRLLATAALVFAALNAAAWWWGRDVVRDPLDVQTRGLFEARVESFFAGGAGPRAVFVGDSVVFGQKLAEKLGPDWAASALPAQFAAAEGGRYAVLNLGINGVLFDELTCVVDEVLRHEPQLLVVNVSPRPFARELTGSRPFLCERPALNAAVPLLRWRDALQWRLFGGPTRETAVQAVKRAVTPPAPPSEEDEDAALLADAMWRIQAAQRFNDIDVSPDHPQAAALRALFARLAEARGTRSVVFYVGENVDAIAQQLDRPRFEEQRRRFVEMAQGLAAGHDNVRFVAIDAEPLRGEYSDHVHLTAEGYRRVAERLRDEVEATGWVVDRR